MLAVGVVRGGDVELSVYLYDTATWDVLQDWHADPSMGETVVSELVFSPDSAMLGVICSKTGACLYDVESGERVAQMPDSAFARDAVFITDGGMLAVVGGEYLRLYDVGSAEIVYEQGITDDLGAYLGVAF